MQIGNIGKFVGALALCAVATFAQAQSGDPIKIGVPMPLTGALAGAGRLILAGAQMATDEVNARGGLLGRPVKLLVEDTKSEPNTAAIVAAKLINQDKVFAFAGGYGSTADFAMLQGIKRQGPIFVHLGSSAVKLEETFGAEPWYYHVYIVDYHRQKGVASFLSSIEPRPKRVAIAHEDGLYGSDAVKFAEQYLTAAGFEVVMKEPYKAGTPDLSPILSRVKSLDPDVFFFVGYSGDNIQIARQAKALGVKPKLLLIVAAGEKRDDFGDFGDGIAVIGEWAPEQKTAGMDDFLKRALSGKSADTKLVPAFVQGYTGALTLYEAIARAGALDREKVLRELSTGTFNTPYGALAYKDSEKGGKHQLLTDATLIVWQYRPVGQEVVWPTAKANGKLIYPVR